MRQLLATGLLIGMAFGLVDASLAAVTGYQVPWPALLVIGAGDLLLGLLASSISGAVRFPFRTRIGGAGATLLVLHAGLALEGLVHTGLRHDELFGWSGALWAGLLGCVGVAGLMACSMRRASSARPALVVFALLAGCEVVLLSLPLLLERCAVELPHHGRVLPMVGLALASLAALAVPATTRITPRALATMAVASVAVPWLATVACRSERPMLPDARHAAVARDSRRSAPNIILVSIDTLRDDHVGPQAGRPSLTPQLDELARQGTRFSVACAPASWTLPSHVSLLTGLYPGTHGVLFDTESLGAHVPTLATLLSEAGYSTVGITGGGYVSERHGLERGFGTFDDRSGYRFYFGHEPAVVRVLRKLKQRPLNELFRIHGGFAPVVDRVVQWFEQRPVEPFFLFLHTYEVHNYFHAYPWLEPILKSRGQVSRDDRLLESQLAPVYMRQAGENAFRTFAELYRAEIIWVDREMGRLLAALERSGLEQRTIVMVVSDHGEGFDLRGDRVYHGGRFHEDLVRVPMILKLPDGRRLDGSESVVNLVDVAPTLLELAGLRGPPMEGRSLLEATASERPCFGEEAYIYDARHPLGKAPIWNSASRQLYVRSGLRKLIRSPAGWQLYDLARDPGERSNLAPGLLPPQDPLTTVLEAYGAAHANGGASQPATSSAADRERLDQLGYGR